MNIFKQKLHEYWNVVYLILEKECINLYTTSRMQPLSWEYNFARAIWTNYQSALSTEQIQEHKWTACPSKKFNFEYKGNP